jgi:hypothetical protein
MSGVVTVSRALTPRNWTSTSDPTNAFDAADGVLVGDHWYNTTSGNVFVCVSNTVGAAVWRHIPRILALSAVAVVAPADTSENILATITVPAGALGVNGSLIISHFVTCTNNANVKTIRHRFNGIGGSVYLAPSIASSAGQTGRSRLSNRGLTNSQVGAAFDGFLSTGPSTSAADTTASTTAVITAQKATAGDTITLESWMAQLFRPDIT